MPAPIYSLRVPEVYAALESSPEGISPDEAQARRTLYGPNLLVERPRLSAWRRISAHLVHPMAILLWVAGVIALLAGEPALALIIWAIILVNAGLSFWQEHRAEQAIQALKSLLPDYARLTRVGEELLLPASEIVIGDVLILAEGDRIPADARVVESYGLRTNEAILAGEAMPARKYADASLREDISEIERPNLVFAGTSIVSGTGRAVVFAIGMMTQFGRIAHLTQTVSEDPSPVQQELRRLTRRLSWIALSISVLVFTVAWADIGFPLLDAFLLALGVLVAAVPEGLPATLALTLAMASQRLARRGVLVKSLNKIETLGSISVICTDKSGTLTQNQMTVRELLVGRQHIRVSGVGYSPEGQFSPNPNGLERQSDIKALLSAAALCNNARLSPPTPEKPLWSSLGDQTEAALKVASMKFGLFETRLEEEYPRLHELPFDARRKRMATIHKITANATNGTYPEPGSGKTPTDLPDATEIALVKGAPREVLHLCTHILLNGVVQDLDDEIRNEVITTNDDYARRALRVLALAYRNLPAHSRPYTVEKVEDDLVFLGLMAMMDPPRPEVSQTVLACRQAGIRLVMITGDYGLTAESMARRIGLLETPTPRIFTGAEMDTITDHDLLEIIKGETIYARMAPEHKLRLVDAFQRIGEVVAVTGDGVNDAPALRKADVGIVMGVTGTDVAKEAADLVITNDNFYSIIAAIEEGRGVFDNLRKFITYIFSSNVPEILPFILAGLLDIPPALTVLQILAIDLGTDLLPALALGAEHPAAGLLQLPPRKRGHPIIDRSLLKRAFLWLGPAEFLLSYTGFFAVYLLSGSLQLERLSDLKAVLQQLWSAPAWVHATTVLVYFAGVLMSQVGNVFAIRFESQNGRLRGWLSNPFLRAGIGIEVFLFIALALYNHSSEHPLGILFWIAIAFFSVILYGMDWFGKRFVSIRKRK